jgi:hypothetical protein
VADRNLKRVQTRMTPQDAELLEWLANFLGTSLSEANRTAIRAFAGQMMKIEKGRRK